MLTTAFIIMIFLSVLRCLDVLVGFAMMVNGSLSGSDWVASVFICALLLFITIALGTVV